MLTKKHWRQPSRVEYIEAGLHKFVEHYGEYGISSVSFPQLGCGHGGLDWESQVQPLMERYLHDLPIPVYIHLYSKPSGSISEQ
jgi:O-acetyl-ADP-ribose deacetylase (regulator of RNase III)